MHFFTVELEFRFTVPYLYPYSLNNVECVKGIFISDNTSVHKVCTPVHKGTYHQVIGGQCAIVLR